MTVILNVLKQIPKRTSQIVHIFSVLSNVRGSSHAKWLILGYLQESNAELCLRSMKGRSYST